MPPNSGAVVWAASTAPVGAQAGHRRVVVVGDPVPEDDGGLGVRPSLDLLELLDAERHAAEGQRHVGPARRLPGPLEVGEAEGVERRRRMAAMQASSASSGESSSARKASTRPQASPSHGVLTRGEYPRAPAPCPRAVGSVPVVKTSRADDAGAPGGRAPDSRPTSAPWPRPCPGDRLRPHVKAHKCTALASRQAAAGHTAVHLRHHRRDGGHGARRARGGPPAGQRGGRRDPARACSPERAHASPSPSTRTRRSRRRRAPVCPRC